MSEDKASKFAFDMPDIASHAEPQVAGSLDWVGMNEIELPIQIEDADGRRMQAVAHISAFVDLAQPEVRGIHMSRLYLHLDRALAERPVTPGGLRHVLGEFLDSHSGLSTRAMLRLDFDYMVRRPSLASANSGWKRYPFSIIATLDEREFKLEMAFQVLYSSTCPCSAALARQLIKEKFRNDFSGRDAVSREEVARWITGEEGIVATPHSQRSSADVRVKLVPGFESFPFTDLIDAVEESLQTPVQSVVKREDEQAFALLNGSNLMFCEDAARRLQRALAPNEKVLDFWARCRHFESLHPHNAVAIVTKGVEGGYQPIDGQPSSWRD